MEIGSIYEGLVIDFTHEGSGVIKHDGFPVFVEGVVIGDTIEFELVEKKKNFGTGRLVKIIGYSIDREEYSFDTSTLGGGVPLINYKYEKQLEWKENKVKQDLMRIGGIDTDIEPIIGMKHPFRYRNHSQIPVGDIDGRAVIGYYKSKSNDIIPLEEDYLQPEIADQIIRTVKDWIAEYDIKVFDKEKGIGVIKHLGIRTNENNEAMLIIVTAFSQIPNKFELIHKLVKECPGIVSIYQNINQEKSKFTYGREYIHLFGQEHLRDYIGDFQFDISPNSFFQVSRVQTKILYETAKEYLQCSKDDIVFDIYSGIGTISLFIAKEVKKVIGIESVSAAVENGRINARNNGVTNSEFYLGKAEEVLPKLIGINKANKVIVDPPRKGCEIEVIEAIIDLAPERIVYVSCNPSTLARDLKILTKENYEVTKVQPVDMFPHSAHVETVVLLSWVDKG